MPIDFLQRIETPVTNGRCMALRFVRELYIIEPASQNLRLTDLCLTYLTFDCLKFDLKEDKVRQSILNGDYAFLEYAANNWLNHLRDLELDRGRLGSEQYSVICEKTKKVLDFHQPSRAHDYTPDADIARYFLAFSECPEIYLHPALGGRGHLKQGSGESLSLSLEYPLLSNYELTSAVLLR